MIVHIIKYTFLNTDCTFETTYLSKLIDKLEDIEKAPEVLPNTIRLSTEERAK